MAVPDHWPDVERRVRAAWAATPMPTTPWATTPKTGRPIWRGARGVPAERTTPRLGLVIALVILTTLILVGGLFVGSVLLRPDDGQPRGRIAIDVGTRIRVIDAATGETQDTLERDGFCPSFTPDGRSLTYFVNNDVRRRTRLWLDALDGTRPRMLVDDDTLRTPVAWAPDGRRFVTVRSGGGDPPPEVWLRSLDAASADLIRNASGRRGVPVWSPDGRWLAMQFFEELVLIAPSGSLGLDDTIYSLAQFPSQTPVQPTWSPDGRRIAFTTSDGLGLHHIAVIDINEREPRILTALDRDDSSPRWSPDGRWIAFLRAARGRPEGDRLMLVDPNTGELRDLSGSEPWAGPIAWSPDGAYLAARDASGALTIMDTNGDVATRTPLGLDHAACISWAATPSTDLPTDSLLPEVTPPASIHMEMVLRNDLLGEADYVVAGSPDNSGGSAGPCNAGGRHDFELTGTWSITVEGTRVLDSRQASAAYVGLPSGGTVTLGVLVDAAGRVEVQDLRAGSVADSITFDAPTAEDCAQPDPDATMPEEFIGRWVAGGYSISLTGGWTERIELSTGTEYIQGRIDHVAGGVVTFRRSEICPVGADYTWSLSDDKSTLTLVSVDDVCEARRRLLTSEPLVRSPQGTLVPGARYVLGDFDPPLALTAPTDPGAPEISAWGGSSDPLFVIGPSSEPDGVAPRRSGIELRASSNATPASCTGDEGWLTGENDDNAPVTPVDLPTLAALLDAFAAWDERQPGVTVGEARELRIAGRPALAIDVVAATTCTKEPGLGTGDILERDYAIDLGGRLLIVSTGPGVYESDAFAEPNDKPAQTYDPELLAIGEQLVMSLELLEAP